MDEDHVSFEIGLRGVQVAADCRSAACAAGRAAVREIAADQRVATR